MKGFPLAKVAALVLFASVARAQEGSTDAPFSSLTGPLAEEDLSRTVVDPGYFNGVGAPGRSWELRADTGFSTSRIFAQRLELGHVFHFSNKQFGIVARVDMGADSDTRSSLYAIQRPIVSVGVWARSPNANYAAQFGIRIIPSSTGPDDLDPGALGLALSSSLVSGIADDAQWLAFEDWNYQIFGTILSRTDPMQIGSLATVFGGAYYGGETSLTPLSVRSWLGPQRGIIANAFLDLFLGLPSLLGSPANIELGVHAEVSLSSVWSGSEPFPFLASGFVGWSPKSWVTARAFAGIAGSAGPAPPTSYPYGASLAFYVP